MTRFPSTKARRLRTVVADSYAEAHKLAEEGVPFALQRADVALEHYVPAGIAVAV